MKSLYSLGMLFVVFCSVADASALASQHDGINVQFSDTPLKSAIEILAAISETPISIDGRHANPPITATLADKSLDEALSAVLRRVSHMIIRQSDGAYSVLIMEGDDAESVDERAPVQTRNADTNPVSLGLGLGEPELFPGRDGSPGLTQTDLDYYGATELQRDAKKIQVIPPVEGVSAGVTLAEIREKSGSGESITAAVVADIHTIPNGEIQ